MQKKANYLQVVEGVAKCSLDGGTWSCIEVASQNA